MSRPSPGFLNPNEHRDRQQRIARLAREFVFMGTIEYRHVYSQSGGAQYGQGNMVADDLLTVYAEAFERDADVKDFSLEAIIAHECGHQILIRHPRIARRVSGKLSEISEEILASLLGAMLCGSAKDRDALVAKAMLELVNCGETIEGATRQLRNLWNLFEGIL